MTVDVIRSCRSKRRYPCEADAQRAIAEVYDREGAWLRVYPCEECHGWHLATRRTAPSGWRPPARPQADLQREARESQQDWRRRRGRGRRHKLSG